MNQSLKVIYRIHFKKHEIGELHINCFCMQVLVCGHTDLHVLFKPVKYMKHIKFNWRHKCDFHRYGDNLRKPHVLILQLDHKQCYIFIAELTASSEPKYGNYCLNALTGLSIYEAPSCLEQRSCAESWLICQVVIYCSSTVGLLDVCFHIPYWLSHSSSTNICSTASGECTEVLYEHHLFVVKKVIVSFYLQVKWGSCLACDLFLACCCCCMYLPITVNSLEMKPWSFCYAGIELDRNGLLLAWCSLCFKLNWARKKGFLPESTNMRNISSSSHMCSVSYILPSRLGDRNVITSRSS